MTLQDLGSLGELIAAIATVAMLAYLAVQIRQNTRALGHASNRAILEDARFIRSQLLQSRDVASLYRKGLMHPDELDPVERLQFRMLLDEVFGAWAYMFRAGSPESESGSHKDHIRGTLAQPGGAEHWARARSAFSPEFAEYIDRVGRSD